MGFNVNKLDRLVPPEFAIAFKNLKGTPVPMSELQVSYLRDHGRTLEQDFEWVDPIAVGCGSIC